MLRRSKIISALVPALAPALTAALTVSGLTLHTAPAAACGGFFCSQTQPVNQAAERIIFADNGDGTVTAVIQIMYEGPAENFSWLLPISSVPDAEGEIAVASDVAFQRLQAATNPQYNLTTRTEGTCRQQNFSGNDASPSIDAPAAEGSSFGDPSGPGGVTVAASGVVGAFEWTALELSASLDNPAAAALDWLTTNGYDVLPQSAELIGPYLMEGMYLLALRLTKGSTTGSIRPIVLTYDGNLPSIPIKLTAVAANDDMGVMTWMLSDARAVPYNYSALELNEARINWFNAAANYESVVTAAADDSGGQGFVTEFAGDSVDLRSVVWQDFEETEWQAVRSQVYTSFGDLFNNAYNRYSSFDGFWDSVRAVVVLPDGLSFEDFRSCPDCYANSITLSPTTFFDAIEDGVIHPLRRVQELIDAQPYVTRLYSTLSAADMTVDPVFTFNASLPKVNNIHTAERIIECNPAVYEFEAPWRIQLPQGGVIRGLAADVGTWPEQVDSQPANLRVLALSDTGPGVVAEDNSEAINQMLASYNATIAASGSIMGGTGRPVLSPSSSGGTRPADMPQSSSGCSLPGVPSGAGQSGAFASFAALVALACSRISRRRLADKSAARP